jgi:hypothetical protein
VENSRTLGARGVKFFPSTKVFLTWFAAEYTMKCRRGYSLGRVARIEKPIFPGGKT